jgi:type II secretory pathway pseudopilin PulG
MHFRNGFTLIETLITTLVLVTGLVGLAVVFSHGMHTSARIRRQTAATALLHSKTEDLRTARELRPGRYSEFVTIGPDGVVTSNDGPSDYQRTWEITPEMPRRITVIVYGRQPSRFPHYIELARATTLVARRF